MAQAAAHQSHDHDHGHHDPQELKMLGFWDLPRNGRNPVQYLVRNLRRPSEQHSRRTGWRRAV